MEKVKKVTTNLRFDSFSYSVHQNFYLPFLFVFLSAFPNPSKSWLPYRGKVRRGKSDKILACDEYFFPTKVLRDEFFSDKAHTTNVKALSSFDLKFYEDSCKQSMVYETEAII